MADAGDSKLRKREWEPITMVCLVVLLVAGAAVLCTFVNDHYLKDDKETVEFGDSVTLDYTGSLYTWYNKSTDDSIAMIFDTSVKKVAQSDKYVFTDSFTDKEKYEQSTIVLGQHKFLAEFEEQLMGHKVGDTVYIHIAGDKAYAGPNNNVIMATTEEIPLTKTFTLSSSEFKTFFGIEAPSSTLHFTYDKIVDGDGNAIAVDANNTGSIISVAFAFEGSKTYTVADNAAGKLAIVTNAGATAYTFSVVDKKDVKDSTVTDSAKTAEVSEIEMLTFSLPGKVTNVLGYDGSHIVYNNNEAGTATLYNMDLYFVVKIVEKN